MATTSSFIDGTNRSRARCRSGSPRRFSRTKACSTAHRIYPGLPETVLSWMSVAHNLTFAPLGAPSLVRPLAKNREGPCGEGCDGGVWHSHDAAAVREWLREAAHA